jgi:hypothetical protein
MKTTRLSTGDVTRITGVDPNLVYRWTTDGVLRETRPRVGQGNHRLFDLPEVIAIAVGARWKKAGLDAGIVRGVVLTLSSRSLEDIAASFREGRTLPVPTVSTATVRFGGGLIEPPRPKNLAERKLLLALDAKAAFDEIRDAVYAVLSPSSERRRKPVKKSVPV